MKDTKNPRFFYDSSTFEFLSPLTESLESIVKELNELTSINAGNSWLETFPSYVHSDQPKAWDVFTFKTNRFVPSPQTLLIPYPNSFRAISHE